MRENRFDDGEFRQNLLARYRSARLWQLVFQASTIIGLIVLTVLVFNVVNGAFGFVAIQNEVDPAALAVDGVSLDKLPKEQLVRILQENVSKGLLRRFESEQPFAKRTRENVYDLVMERVVEPQVVHTWPLYDALFRRVDVRAEAAEKYPDARIEFVSWIDPAFVTTPQSSDPERAGVRTAILGSLWTIAITILFAFPLGVGAAIYLEEYATDNWLNRLIRTNINNLAGVPSIIYGMLGLAIFVRALEPLSSGKLFGLVEPTTAHGSASLTTGGRTILSAGLTLGLLILPLILINGQEALRAVPASARRASCWGGATPVPRLQDSGWPVP